MTLSDGITTITLPADLAWEDRFGWSPIVQTVDNVFNGAVIVERWERQAGRPITLTAADDRAWITTEDAEALQSWADSGAAQLTLSGLLDEPDHQVVFRHQDAPALDLRPLWPGDYTAAEYWIGTLKLMVL